MFFITNSRLLRLRQRHIWLIPTIRFFFLPLNIRCNCEWLSTQLCNRRHFINYLLKSRNSKENNILYSYFLRFNLIWKLFITCFIIIWCPTTVTKIWFAYKKTRFVFVWKNIFAVHGIKWPKKSFSEARDSLKNSFAIVEEKTSLSGEKIRGSCPNIRYIFLKA